MKTWKLFVREFSETFGRGNRSGHLHRICTCVENQPKVETKEKVIIKIASNCKQKSICFEFD